MIIACHQLHYLPWIRYFDKIMRSDAFVVLEDIQFNKNGWQNRNRIKGPNGAMCLTVPVLHRYQQRLDEVRVNGKTKWARKHWKSLLLNYTRSPYFREHGQFFQSVYQREWERLNDLNYEILSYLVESLGIETKIVRSSDLSVRGAGTRRLINICQTFPADTYLSGMYGTGTYLDVNMFKEAGIKVITQDWECPVYSQQHRQVDFISDLSVVDLLFNHGPQSMDIVLGKGKDKRNLSSALDAVANVRATRTAEEEAAS